MLKIGQNIHSELTSTQITSLNELSEVMKGWDGRFTRESKQATYYTFSMMYFYKSLMHHYFPDDEESRIKIVDNYNFVDYIERSIIDIEQGLITEAQNKLCMDAFPDYKGKNYCAYNVAMAFVQANDYLNAYAKGNEELLRWDHHHYNEYSNLPWSKTPLKFIFHRDVPTFGTTNSPHVSKVSYRRGI